MNENRERNRELEIKYQRERFKNMSVSQKKDFLIKLTSKDGLNEDQAKIVYGLFETGEAGSVGEAKKLMAENDKPISYTDI